MVDGGFVLGPGVDSGVVRRRLWLRIDIGYQSGHDLDILVICGYLKPVNGYCL
jgi:hypothetical protein